MIPKDHGYSGYDIERFFFVFLFFFFETYKFDVAGEEGEKRRCSCGAVSR